MKRNQKLTARILYLLERDPGKAVKELAQELKVNRTFLSGYLEAMEDQGYLKSKKIGSVLSEFYEE